MIVYFVRLYLSIRPAGTLGRSGMMNNTAERLLELDVRHGELLDKLARLDQQIDDVLKEWMVAKEVQSELSIPAINAT